MRIPLLNTDMSRVGDVIHIKLYLQDDAKAISKEAVFIGDFFVPWKDAVEDPLGYNVA